MTGAEASDGLRVVQAVVVYELAARIRPAKGFWWSDIGTGRTLEAHSGPVRGCFPRLGSASCATFHFTSRTVHHAMISPASFFTPLQLFAVPVLVPLTLARQPRLYPNPNPRSRAAAHPLRNRSCLQRGFGPSYYAAMSVLLHVQLRSANPPNYISRLAFF